MCVRARARVCVRKRRDLCAFVCSCVSVPVQSDGDVAAPEDQRTESGRHVAPSENHCMHVCVYVGQAAWGQHGHRKTTKTRRRSKRTKDIPTYLPELTSKQAHPLLCLVVWLLVLFFRTCCALEVPAPRRCAEPPLLRALRWLQNCRAISAHRGQKGNASRLADVEEEAGTQAGRQAR